jgi:hypothetical protein
MNELIQNLVNNLGVKEDQAKGGTGLLFKLAKEKLGGGEFSQISEHVPGIEDLVQAAPESGGGLVERLEKRLPLSAVKAQDWETWRVSQGGSPSWGWTAG